MYAFLTVFLGAGIGGMLRHGANIAAVKLLGSGFPFGTFAVNVLGSFLMGLAIEFFALRYDPGQHWRLLLTTGLLGGFTTFSTFSLDTALMIERGQMAFACAYLLLSVAVGLAALFAGLALVRTLA